MRFCSSSKANAQTRKRDGSYGRPAHMPTVYCLCSLEISAACYLGPRYDIADTIVPPYLPPLVTSRSSHPHYDCLTVLTAPVHIFSPSWRVEKSPWG